MTHDRWSGDVKPFPELGREAFHGQAGEFVDLIAPHTEADPAALLLQHLCMFGNCIGRGPHALAEADKHGTNLFVALVGVSSKSRKGSSLGRIKAQFRAVDDVWATDRIVTGLSSGEGLIWQVRDPIMKQERVGKGKGASYETVVADDGIQDKRLLVVQPELASTCRVLGRDGNTLSAVMRDAWDSGDLNCLTKNSPAKASGALISIIGHVTKDELLRYLDRSELGNGFANRFLFCCVRRARVLPFGGNLDQANLAPHRQRLYAALDSARRRGDSALAFDSVARNLWVLVYEQLSEGRPGLLGAVTSRAEAQVLRLALIFALLDEAREIGEPHLGAALAVWKYAAASAAFVFGDALGDPVADEILRALKAKSEGMSREKLRELFQRNRSAAEISRALAVLVEYGLARWEPRPTAGRTAEIWNAVTAAGAGQNHE